MSGVYIRGMAKPKSCFECRLFVDGWCCARPAEYIDKKPTVFELESLCPIIEIPDNTYIILPKTAKKEGE